MTKISRVEGFSLSARRCEPFERSDGFATHRVAGWCAETNDRLVGWVPCADGCLPRLNDQVADLVIGGGLHDT